MSELSDFYNARRTMKKHGSLFTESQEAALRKFEDDFIENEALKELKQKIQEVLSQLECGVELVADYTPGKELDIIISRKEDKEDSGEGNMVKEETPEEKYDTVTYHRSGSVGFTVKFADGTVISNKNAKETFIQALRHMSLQRVSGFTGRTFAEFPLVGKRRRITGDGYKWQEEVDGWWIYINMSNDTKMSMLQQVASYLGVDLSVEINGQNVSEQQSDKPHGKRAMFSLNGGAQMNKRNSVLAAVRLYIKNNPLATFSQIESAFPRSLQGGYGVVASMGEIERRREKSNDVDNRYFGAV